MHGFNNFKQENVKKAILAAKTAGIEIGRVDVDKSGKISIYPASSLPAAEGGNPAPYKDAPGAGRLQSWDD